MSATPQRPATLSYEEHRIVATVDIDHESNDDAATSAESAMPMAATVLMTDPSTLNTRPISLPEASEHTSSGPWGAQSASIGEHDRVKSPPAALATPVAKQPASTHTSTWHVTSPLPQDVVSALSGDDEAATTAITALLAENPRDIDALFRLAVILHRVGQIDLARIALTTLAQVYQADGNSTQAQRIMAMLGASATTKGSAESTTRSNGHSDTPTAQAVFTSATHPTVALDQVRIPRTDGLQQVVSSNGASSASHVRTPVQPVIHFPIEEFTFTDPLPSQFELSPELQQAIAESTANIRDGKLDAALDACYAALAIDPRCVPVHVRIAELSAMRRQHRKARQLAETLIRLARAHDDEASLWMVYRVLLHTQASDLPNLRRLVELLIEARRTDLASFYASKLIQLLDQEGLTTEAATYSASLCDLIPGDTRAALENAILRVREGNPNAAIDRWESAVAAGANETIGKASLAAIMSAINEDDHWRMVAESAKELRTTGDEAIREAYKRTAEAMPSSTMLKAGLGIILSGRDDKAARPLLAQAAGDRLCPPFTRAVAAVGLAQIDDASDGTFLDERAAAIRTAIQCLEDPEIAANSAWPALLGATPRSEDLAVELGKVLLGRGDLAGALDILTAAHKRSKHHDRVCQALADAYFKAGQLGSALSVLDELAGHYKATGYLDEMATVLRQMSLLAPNNIKVKTRLIETYLQRGFVAEARAELVLRADLEERNGLIKDAITSLVRAADLSWTIGLAEETFAIYLRVLELAPEAVDHRHGLVTLYLQMGRVQEAAEHQRAIVDLSLRENRKHEAIAALHQVIGLTPDDTSAYYQLAELLASVGEFGQAERVYRRILAIHPQDAIAHAKSTAMAALKEQEINRR